MLIQDFRPMQTSEGSGINMGALPMAHYPKEGVYVKVSITIGYLPRCAVTFTMKTCRYFLSESENRTYVTTSGVFKVLKIINLHDF